MHDVCLKYTDMAKDCLQSYIRGRKQEKSGHVATVIHEWRLAWLSMDLVGNNTVEGGELGQYHYRQTWDKENYHAGPAIRWLADELVPFLLGEPANAEPNKAVIFAPLLGQAWFTYWYLKTSTPRQAYGLLSSMQTSPDRKLGTP